MNNRGNRIYFTILGVVAATIITVFIGAILLKIENIPIRTFTFSLILYSLYILFSFTFNLRKEDKVKILKGSKPLEKTTFFDALIMLGFSLILSLIFTLIVTKLFPDFARKAFDQNINFEYSNNIGMGILERFLIFLSIVVIAPLVEEIIFRGVFFNLLNDKMNVIYAIVFSSAFFGLLHGGVVIQTALAGMCLAYIYHRSGSLKLAMLIHGINNFIAYFTSTILPILEDLLPLKISFILGNASAMVFSLFLITAFIITSYRIITRSLKLGNKRATPLYRP